MERRFRFSLGHATALAAVAFAWLSATSTQSAQPPATFTIATWNLENYLEAPVGTRPAKPPEARTVIRRTLVSLAPDVLALQEIGGTNALLELRDALRRDGLDYPHWALAGGYDTNIQVALLSRLPMARHQVHDRESFLLRGRRLRTTRGILEADLQGPAGYRFTMLVVHLKSRRESTAAAQDEIREEEARVLRRLIDARLQSEPNLNLVVLGDFNDLKGSRPLQLLLGRGRTALVDTRPAEGPLPEGSASPAAGHPFPRTVTWTHFFAKEDTYSRVDYLLVSPGMARELDRSGTFVLARRDWGLASDHRPVIARFHCPNR